MAAVIGILAVVDGHHLATHGMGQRACAEIGVAAVVGGDHIEAEHQGFCQPSPEALSAVHAGR